MPTIQYTLEPHLSPAEFIDVLVRSTLAERRHVDQPETIAGMLRHADVILTAGSEGKLVGISRAITDFAYCTYFSSLAVDVAFQKSGIGRELIRRTHEAAGTQTRLSTYSGQLLPAYWHNSCG